MEMQNNAKENGMQKEKVGAAMERRYGRLAARLAKLGFVLQGTITERSMVRPDPKNPKKEKTYGPYYQWTFKRKGKTTTVNLTASQAKTYQRAIDNHRKMEETMEKMRTLSLKILEAKTEGVKKRKPRD
jgi:hypothetical protein